MRLADAETLADANGAEPSGNGAAGSIVSATDNGGAARAAGKTRETLMEEVDSAAVARIRKAENAEETRKKEAAFIEPYDSLVKEVHIPRLSHCRIGVHAKFTVFPWLFSPRRRVIVRMPKSPHDGSCVYTRYYHTIRMTHEPIDAINRLHLSMCPDVRVTLSIPEKFFYFSAPSLLARSQAVEQWQNMHTGRTDEGYARCGMPKCAKASGSVQ